MVCASEVSPSTTTNQMTEKLFNDYEIKSELQKIEQWKLVVKAGELFPPQKLEISEIKDYGSLSTVNLKELAGSNEMNLMLDSMSVDTMEI